MNALVFPGFDLTNLYQLVLTFFFSQSLFAASRCANFYSEILSQDISSDVYRDTTTPIASLGFQKKYFFDEKKSKYIFF